jgi:hypothetical protein
MDKVDTNTSSHTSLIAYSKGQSPFVKCEYIIGEVFCQGVLLKFLFRVSF